MMATKESICDGAEDQILKLLLERLAGDLEKARQLPLFKREGDDDGRQILQSRKEDEIS